MKIIGYNEIKDVFGMIIGVIPILEEVIEHTDDKPAKKNHQKKDK